MSGNLLALLEPVMILLHPVMPFVTEEIYGYLPQVRVRATVRPASSTRPTRTPHPEWADAGRRGGDGGLH